MNPKPPSATTAESPGFLAPFGLGLWIGLNLLKFGNPVIMGSMMEVPEGFFELLFTTWPLKWAYPLTIILLAPAAWHVIKSPTALAVFKHPLQGWSKVWFFLPLAWIGWQFLSMGRSIQPELSHAVVSSFSVCVAAFYLGSGTGIRFLERPAFWWPLLLCFLFMLWLGLGQHYGGLEATREAFYAQPDWQKFPKEYIARVESKRIFASLVYANAFAGVLLLLTPFLAVRLWRRMERASQMMQAVVVGLFVYASAACLFWTGSKTAWLVGIGVGALALMRGDWLTPKQKRLAVLVFVVIGLAGFGVRYAGYFKKGALSAAARVTYWQGAVTIFTGSPVLGSGPGTFSKAFAPIKPPDAEMARLVHNDYLQQASDSGFPGFCFYLFFSVGIWVKLYRYSLKSNLPLVLGVFAWAAQSFFEFFLYIPALSWGVFYFMGALTRAGISGSAEQHAGSTAR